MKVNIIKRDAWIEDNYRYSLTREWTDGNGLLVSCMLNPSTANAAFDDPTLLRNMHFAAHWGFQKLEVVNMFAWRSPLPEALLAAKDPVGSLNDVAIDRALYRADTVLVAWGNPPRADLFYKRMVPTALRIMNIATLRRIPVVCLGRTMHHHPKHPLARGVHRVPDNQQPVPYSL